MINKAEYNDLQEILKLQYLSYQSKAALFGNKNIPPLKQTLDGVIYEFNNGIILKMVIDNRIIGSVRAKEENGTVYFQNNDRKFTYPLTTSPRSAFCAPAPSSRGSC